ncbi:MAG: FliH/SctL family protein [Clostridiales bacterium]|nr:FliH/SctL family protein [Clostridiales bacterium]
MRSLPDIYKLPWFAIPVGDIVEIPELSMEAALAEKESAMQAEESRREELLAGDGDDDLIDGDGYPFEERRKSDRRQGDRRKSDRRAEDSENPDSVNRLYRERLALTKEEFFVEIEPELRSVLQRQMEEIRNEAFGEALNQQRTQISAVLDELDRKSKEQEERYRNFMKEFAEELKYMALDIAERILHKEIVEDKHALDSMILQMVSEVKNATWISVEISDQAESLAEQLRTQLQKAEQGKQIFIEMKDIPPDAVRIVTEEGIVDATLSVQLKQLREAFMKAEEEGD